MNIPEIKITVNFDKKVKKSELVKITGSKTSYETFKRVFDLDTFDWTEQMIVLCLNRSHKVVGFYKLSSGGFDGTVCDPKVVFTIALNCAASAIILGHNHPSGNLKPSNEDIKITKKISEGWKLLDIVLLDHIIMTDEGYYSFADEALI